MPKILFIIAPQGYQDFEYEEPKRVLEKKGHEVITASTTQQATGSLGGSTQTDLLITEADPNNYDAIAFIGGPGSPIYFENQTAHELARNFHEAQKPTCAICAAPIILGKAGLLRDKKATCYPGGADQLKATGANYTAKSIEKDGLLITADGPSSAKKFGKVIAKNL
jgi:protease I